MRTLRRTRGYIWKSRGPRPGNGIRGPLLHCARVAFVGVSSDGHPTVSPPDRAQREQDEGRDQVTRARTLAGQIGRRAPHGRPAGASGLNVAPRPARLCPHTHPHTHPHTRPHNTTLMQTTAKGGQSAGTGRATPQRPILRWHQDAHTPQGLHRISFRGPLGVRHCPATSTGCFRAFGVVAYFSSTPVGGPRSL